MVSGDFIYVECWNELKVKNWKIAEATVIVVQQISPFKFIICFTHSNSLKLNSLWWCFPWYLIWHRWWLLTSEIIESLIFSLCWLILSRASDFWCNFSSIFMSNPTYFLFFKNMHIMHNWRDLWKRNLIILNGVQNFLDISKRDLFSSHSDKVISLCVIFVVEFLHTRNAAKQHRTKQLVIWEEEN